MIDALKSHFPGFLDPAKLVTVVSDLSPILRQMHRSRLQRKAQAFRRQAPSKHTTPHNLTTKRRRPKNTEAHRGVSCNTTNHSSSFVTVMWQGILEVSPLSCPRTLLSTSLRVTWPASRVYYAAWNLASEMARASSSSPESRMVFSGKRSHAFGRFTRRQLNLARRYLECRDTAIVRSTRHIAGHWCYSSHRLFSVNGFFNALSANGRSGARVEGGGTVSNARFSAVRCVKNECFHLFYSFLKHIRNSTIPAQRVGAPLINVMQVA